MWRNMLINSMSGRAAEVLGPMHLLGWLLGEKTILLKYQDSLVRILQALSQSCEKLGDK